MGSARGAGAGLVRFLNEASTSGVREALRTLNLESLAGRPIEEVFAGRDHPFAGLTLDQAREPLRAWIAMRALSEDVARWVDVLRQRTTVRVLVVLDTAAGAVHESEEHRVGTE